MVEFAQFVSRLGSQILTAENFHALLPDTLERIGHHFDATFVGCYLARAGEAQEVRWDREITDQARAFTATPWLRGIVPAGLHIRVVHGAGDEGQRLASAGLDRATIVSVPLGSDEAIHLVLAQRPGEEGSVSEAELGALTTTLGLGVSRYGLQEAAVYDTCTGLFNRRYLDNTLERELQRAQRFRVAMSLLILDLDHFKEVNDQHGHLAGDRLLGRVGAVLRDCVRACDTVARFGGDEFVMILPATSLSGARNVAQRIVRRVRRLRVGSGEQAIRMSVSGGAAAANVRSTAQSLLAAADELLYEAKRQGRDRFIFPERTKEMSPQLNLLAVPSAPYHRVSDSPAKPTAKP